jgi:hypothetical protein
MTALQMIALLMTPLGGLLLGAWAYWVATRPEKNSRHHPAE